MWLNLVKDKLTYKSDIYKIDEGSWGELVKSLHAVVNIEYHPVFPVDTIFHNGYQTIIYWG